MNPSLEIDFLEVTKDSIIKEYEFLDYEGPIEKNENKIFQIDPKYFKENDEEIHQFCFTLYTKDRKSRIDFYIKLFNGTNHVLFKGKANLELKYKGQEEEYIFKKYDTNKNENRKRYLLINFNYSSLSINNTRIPLLKFFPNNESEEENDDDKHYSLEYSFYSIKGKVVLSKLLKDNKQEKKYEDIFKDYDSKLQNFKEKLLKLKQQIINDELNNKEYNNEIEKFQKDASIGIIPLVSLNKSKSIKSSKVSL